MLVDVTLILNDTRFLYEYSVDTVVTWKSFWRFSPYFRRVLEENVVPFVMWSENLTAFRRFLLAHSEMSINYFLFEI